MALFERPSPHDLFSLFRVGFAARLRWELSDTYLSLSSNAKVSRSNERASSTVFFFNSDDSLPSSHTRNAASKLTETPWPSRSMLVAVLARPTGSSDTSFLALSGGAPHLTDAPGLVKLSFPRGIDSPDRVLIALQRPGPGGLYLSLAGSGTTASLVSSVSKRELFHLEILPGTLGKGFLKGPFDGAQHALSPVQSLSLMLLELGVRFRLRSAHSRVLRRDDGGDEVVAVLQNGPQTQLEETNEKELILTAYKVDGNLSGPDGYTRALFVFKDVNGGKVLSVVKSNLDVSRTKTLCETVALLVPEGKSAKPVCVQSRNGWGMVNLGSSGVQSREDKDRSGSCEWLMAGLKGRLEIRSSASSWETFRFEFVRQSFDMALRELPKSPLYKIASEATHTAVRAEIAAAIAQVQSPTNLKTEKQRKVAKTGGFDHSAALAGLSEPKIKSKRGDVKIASTKVSGDKGPAGSKVQQKGAVRTATAGAAAGSAAGSTLPRNQANRKASKRNKKKQKARNAKRTAAASKAGSASSASGAAVGAQNPHSNSKSEGVRTDKASDGDNSKQSGSDDSPRTATKENVSGSSGPPCAACGRAVEGTYTTALGKNFHPHCFCCGKCRRPMGVGAGQFRERGGIPYCQSCYSTHLASRCARCSQPIMDTVITAMEKTWHKACLTCTICRLPLTQTFWLYADKPNEPRCSRCVTGNEEYVGRGGSASGRMVNMPFGRNNAQSLPRNAPAASGGASGQSGRVRLMAPVLPKTTRR